VIVSVCLISLFNKMSTAAELTVMSVTAEPTDIQLNYSPQSHRLYKSPTPFAYRIL